jgi:hypothetical protein
MPPEKPTGLLSSDNPYSCRDEIEKWLAWDTAWHKLALEVAHRNLVGGKRRSGSVDSAPLAQSMTTL